LGFPINSVLAVVEEHQAKVKPPLEWVSIVVVVDVISLDEDLSKDALALELVLDEIMSVVPLVNPEAVVNSSV